MTAITVGLLSSYCVPGAMLEGAPILYLPAEVGIITLMFIGKERLINMATDTQWVNVSAGIQTQARMTPLWAFCCLMETAFSLGGLSSSLRGLTVFIGPLPGDALFSSGLEIL